MPIVSRGLPSANSDIPGFGVGNRGGRYGEQYVKSDGSAPFYADEGTYWAAANAVGTPTAASAATALVATTPYIVIFNNNSVVSGTRIYLDFIKLVCTTAGASGTAVAFVAQTDTGNRFTSGGTPYTPVNVNRDAPASLSTGAVINVGAVTATAATASRNVAQDETLRSTIIIVNDKFLFDFAGRGASMASSQAATLSNFYVPCPPVVIGPQQSFLLNLWMPSGSASTFATSIAYWER